MACLRRALGALGLPFVASLVGFAGLAGPAWPAGHVAHRAVVRFETRRLTEQGGRLDWFRGQGHDLIAFDAVTDRPRRGTEVFTMRPDGSGVLCVTGALRVHHGLIGNPCWHPSGAWLVVQVASVDSPDGPFNHPGFGLDNDLWLVDREGTTAQLLYRVPLHGAALSPQVSPDGTTLWFAERAPSGLPDWYLALETPGGEDPWDGWSLHRARLTLDDKGRARLTGHRTLRPLGPGFYEPSAVDAGGDLTFAWSASHKPRLDDVYRMRPDGSDVRNLTSRPRTFDAFGVPSPSGSALAFASSRVDPTWRATWSRPELLQTELYLTREGWTSRLSFRNSYVQPLCRSYVSDSAWDRTGSRLAYLVEFFHERRPLEPRASIYVVEFPGPP